MDVIDGDGQRLLFRHCSDEGEERVRDSVIVVRLDRRRTVSQLGYGSREHAERVRLGCGDTGCGAEPRVNDGSEGVPRRVVIGLEQPNGRDEHAIQSEPLDAFAQEATSSCSPIAGDDHDLGAVWCVELQRTEQRAMQIGPSHERGVEITVLARILPPGPRPDALGERLQLATGCLAQVIVEP